jgi:hypothetical protein
MGIRTDPVNELTVEIQVAVGGSQLASMRDPLGFYSTTPDESMRLNFEQIREVGAHRDFEVESDRIAAIVDEIEIFVDSFGDTTAYRQ